MLSLVFAFVLGVLCCAAATHVYSAWVISSATAEDMAEFQEYCRQEEDRLRAESEDECP